METTIASLGQRQRSPQEMKQAFQILKDKPQTTVVLTRDSVCAGDDGDAPHEKTITTHSFTDPVVLARETSSGYLPSVAGIGHSWICVLNEIQNAGGTGWR
jgi:hypothetical protein